MADKVKISSSSAGQDIVGRDKITTNFHSSYKGSEYLERLYQKLSAEEKTEIEKNFIEELQFYVRQNAEDLLGLEKKLERGNRTSYVWYAKESKERYHKKLIKTAQFSEAAQKINLYILSNVRTAFLTDIYPRILENADASTIDSLINERIIKPTMAELGPNFLEFTSEDIFGMIYFLTGNCHLKWNK